MADHLQVVTTTDSEETAAELARGVVRAGLGACVQVAQVRSFYVWDGEAQDDPEWQLQVKTSAGRSDELIAQLRREHNYDVPEIIALPITGGSEDYLAWIDEETGQQ